MTNEELERIDEWIETHGGCREDYEFCRGCEEVIDLRYASSKKFCNECYMEYLDAE